LLAWPALVFSAPAVSLSDLSQAVVQSEPFLFHFSVLGLSPQTQYEMTARLRRADSTTDQGSFMIQGVFGTSY
jgi:hypothetical protein